VLLLGKYGGVINGGVSSRVGVLIRVFFINEMNEAQGFNQTNKQTNHIRPSIRFPCQSQPSSMFQSNVI
jgi:hypothetical protein